MTCIEHSAPLPGLRLRIEAVSALVPRQALRPAAAVALAALVGVAALRSRSLLAPLRDLQAPQPGWLVLALALELGALVAYAAVIRRLLALGGVRAGIGALLRPTVGGIALGASLPGGQAASGVYWYRHLRRTGADGQLAGVAMVGAMLLGIGSLGAILVAGVGAAGDHGLLAPVRLPILAGAGALVLLAVVFHDRAAAILRRVAPALTERLSLSRRAVAELGVYAVANWLFDCACLYVSLRAMHATVPAQSIMLTFALAALVGSIPLLPGGGGTVEATLALGFAAFGHGSGAVLAGILLFRVISCWGLVPVGWLVVALDGRVGPRAAATLRSFGSAYAAR